MSMSKLEIVLYKVLFALGLGWKYNQLKCKLGIYHQYQLGICGYCGKKH